MDTTNYYNSDDEINIDHSVLLEAQSLAKKNKGGGRYDPSTREERTQARILRNRAAANASRLKKKKVTEHLERNNHLLQSENERLIQRVKDLEAQNSSLESRLNALSSQVATLLGNQNPVATSSPFPSTVSEAPPPSTTVSPSPSLVPLTPSSVEYPTSPAVSLSVAAKRQTESTSSSGDLRSEHQIPKGMTASPPRNSTMEWSQSSTRATNLIHRPSDSISNSNTITIPTQSIVIKQDQHQPLYWNKRIVVTAPMPIIPSPTLRPPLRKQSCRTRSCGVSLSAQQRLLQSKFQTMTTCCHPYYQSIMSTPSTITVSYSVLRKIKMYYMVLEKRMRHFPHGGHRHHF